MASLSYKDHAISRSGSTAAPYEQVLYSELDATIAHYQHEPTALIQVLHRAQEMFGYLKPDVVAHVARELRLPLSHVNGVIGFYSYFSKTPFGKYTIRLCTGTACYVRGADQVLRGLQKELGIRPGETTADGRFSLRCARCIGACGLAPVLMINNDVQSKLRSDRIRKVLSQYK